MITPYLQSINSSENSSVPETSYASTPLALIPLPPVTLWSNPKYWIVGVRCDLNQRGGGTSSSGGGGGGGGGDGVVRFCWNDYALFLYWYWYQPQKTDRKHSAVRI